jgi:hypothetical protein
MLPLLPCFQRDRRAAVKYSLLADLSRNGRRTNLTRERKGLKACIKSVWRRAGTGSNHISAYGVWRDRARRVMARVNRMGETRWHRLPAAARAVNFLREMP